MRAMAHDAPRGMARRLLLAGNAMRAAMRTGGSRKAGADAPRVKRGTISLVVYAIALTSLLVCPCSDLHVILLVVAEFQWRITGYQQVPLLGPAGI
jgi:hypothetical protein